ncbi:MAG: C1 family peptidase [Kiritimatiellia bacterium]
MKKSFYSVFAALTFVLPASSVFAIPNPAAVYAQKLGYECRVVKTKAGEKSLVNLPSGDRVDAWDFFRGKVGSDYGYGAQFGYDTFCKRLETNGYVQEYAVCVPKGAKKLADGASVGEIALLDLMEQNGEPLLDDSPRPLPPAFKTAEAQPSLKALPKAALPSSFNWTNYNGHSYIGSVRDQGGCGSCYSFGACAAAEGAYNFVTGNYDDNRIDFSESFIVWCLGSLPAYSSHFGGCDGADYDYMELAALTNEGVILESAFPYQETDPGSCTHWGDPATVFDSWGRTISGDIDSIKTAIMTYGVVDAAMLTDSAWESYSGGIYDNSNTNCTDGYNTTSDHAVSLIGWNDADGGYWIMRNSWGSSWGEGGYMRMRYDAAAIHCAVSYVSYAPPTRPSVVITNPASSPFAVGYAVSNYNVRGTCNSNTIGQLRWTNSLTGVFGTTNAAASWSLGSVVLNVGTNLITVRGTNSLGESASNSVSIIRQVQVAGQAPVISFSPTGNIQRIPAGQQLNMQVIATEPNGDAVTLQALSLPAGATFTGASGYSPVSDTFAWTPPTTGVFQARFKAFDADGGTTSKMDIYVQTLGGTTNVYFQGFEGTVTDTWKVVSANAITNKTGASDTPANQRIRTGLKSWQPGEGLYMVETLELTNVDISAYGDVIVEVRLSATSTDSGYGMWPGDTISFYTALNGGAYPSTADIEIQGNDLSGSGVDGVLWRYSATNVAFTTAGVARVFSPPAGGLTASGYSTVRIALPAGTSAVKLKSMTYLEYPGYYYNVDDIRVTGRPLSNPATPPDLGPACSYNGAGQMIFQWSSDAGTLYSLARSTNLLTDPFRVMVSNINVNAYTTPVGSEAISIYRIEKQ